MATNVIIDPEFEQLGRQLKPEEANLLEQDLLAHGCLDPIILWAGHGIVIDGHNRHRICEQLGVGYKTREISLVDRDAVKDWIIDHQLGRRNLTDEEKAYYRGLKYKQAKKSQGGTGANQHKQSGQNVHSAKTASVVADECGVDEKTIRRDAKFAEAVDTLSKTAGKEVKQEILSGKSGLTKKAVVEIAKLPEPEQPAAIASAKSKPAATKPSGVKTEVDVFVDSLGKMIDRVNALVARFAIKHNQQSTALVEHLEKAKKLAKAMERSWRNE